MPSGLHNCWRLWRHCCCRYGLYTAAVAPVATTGFFLSLFSSVGCRFLTVEIGFTPINSAMNSSSTEIGLFLHYNPDLYDDNDDNNDNKYRDYIHNNDCVAYSDVFEQAFVDHDRTWKIARVMAMVAAGAGGLAACISWLIVITPVPANCLWPGVLLPTVMMAFISEGSKFLFFDNAMCRSNIWYPSGVDSLPTSAESCSLGPSAIFAIAAGAVHLVTLLMVCLKAPEKRELDPDFGVLYTTGAEMDLEEAKDQREPSLVAAQQQQQARGSNNPAASGARRSVAFDGSSAMLVVPNASNESSHLQPTCDSSISDVYTNGGPEDVSTIGGSQQDTIAGSQQEDSQASSTGGPPPLGRQLSNRSNTPPRGGYHHHSHSHHHSSTTTSSTLPDVSSSRLSALSKAQRSAHEAASPDALVAQLVSDLDNSFRDGGSTSED